MVKMVDYCDTSGVAVTPGYLYHATHGMRLRSIQSKGLIVWKGYSNKKNTGNIYFCTDPVRGVKWWVETPISAASGFFPFKGDRSRANDCYQGACVLRVKVSELLALGYELGLEGYYVGTKPVDPSLLELYCDRRWQPLTMAKLPPVPMFAQILYKINRWMVVRDR